MPGVGRQRAVAARSGDAGDRRPRTPRSRSPISRADRAIADDQRAASRTVRSCRARRSVHSWRSALRTTSSKRLAATSTPITAYSATAQRVDARRRWSGSCPLPSALAGRTDRRRRRASDTHFSCRPGARSLRRCRASGCMSTQAMSASAIIAIASSRVANQATSRLGGQVRFEQRAGEGGEDGFHQYRPELSHRPSRADRRPSPRPPPRRVRRGSRRSGRNPWPRGRRVRSARRASIVASSIVASAGRNAQFVARDHRQPQAEHAVDLAHRGEAVAGMALAADHRFQQHQRARGVQVVADRRLRLLDLGRSSSDPRGSASKRSRSRSTPCTSRFKPRQRGAPDCPR